MSWRRRRRNVSQSFSLKLICLTRARRQIARQIFPSATARTMLAACESISTRRRSTTSTGWSCPRSCWGTRSQSRSSTSSRRSCCSTAPRWGGSPAGRSISTSACMSRWDLSACWNSTERPLRISYETIRLFLRRSGKKDNLLWLVGAGWAWRSPPWGQRCPRPSSRPQDIWARPLQSANFAEIFMNVPLLERQQANMFLWGQNRQQLNIAPFFPEQWPSLQDMQKKQICSRIEFYFACRQRCKYLRNFESTSKLKIWQSDNLRTGICSGCFYQTIQYMKMWQ